MTSASKPSIEQQVNPSNLRHSYRRGPGGSTEYYCQCGARENYTSWDTLCGVAIEAAVRSCLTAFSFEFKEDVQNCKGGRAVRFLVPQPARFGPGEEAFLPLEKADHSIQLWEHLPEAAKHFIRWRMAEFSGSSDLRHREELRLTLSQAAYEAVRRQKDGVEGVA